MLPVHHKNGTSYEWGFGVRDYVVIHDGWPRLTKNTCFFELGDVFYEVRAKWVTYTHTYYDPEVDHRKILPQRDRKELRSN
jgi:hypothetical protein